MQMQVMHQKGQLSDTHYQYNYVYLFIFLHSLTVVNKELGLITDVTHFKFRNHISVTRGW